MPMKLRRKTKSGLSIKDRQWIKKQIEAKLSVETLERRELLAADIIGGMADVAEGENDPKVQMRLVATDLQGQPVDTVLLNQTQQQIVFDFCPIHARHAFLRKDDGLPDLFILLRAIG